MMSSLGKEVLRNTCLKCGDKCEDKHIKCNGWAAIGECQKNPRYMLVYCLNACGTCDFVESLPKLGFYIGSY